MGATSFRVDRRRFLEDQGHSMPSDRFRMLAAPQPDAPKKAGQ